MQELDKILNIAPDEDQEDVFLPEVMKPPLDSESTQGKQDFDYARENLYDVISKGQEALFDMLDVAKQSQHPRAYEVLSTLINTLVSANKDLLELQKKKKDLFKTEETPQTINNNLFVGSTAELQKLISDAKRKTDE